MSAKWTVEVPKVRVVDGLVGDRKGHFSKAKFLPLIEMKVREWSLPQKAPGWSPALLFFLALATIAAAYLNKDAA